MKAIMISDKPIWCAKIMNGEKTIEVRKNKALANAIQKLIDENGYADIYVYCSKGKPFIYPIVPFNKEVELSNFDYGNDYEKLNGKVVFKFRCYKVEEILNYGLARRSEIIMEELLKCSCLTMEQLNKYAPHKEYDNDDYIYAIHISNLKIFDEPKELSEFKIYGCKEGCPFENCWWNGTYSSCEIRRLTKAPQNFCYIESEE